mgnify:FL=1
MSMNAEYEQKRFLSNKLQQSEREILKAELSQIRHMIESLDERLTALANELSAKQFPLDVKRGF